MKRVSVFLSSIATALLLASSAPTLAQTFQELSQQERDECLLISKNCADEVDDIYQRMHRLDKEIRKGTKVYTPTELRRLKEKLFDVSEMLRRLEEE